MSDLMHRGAHEPAHTTLDPQQRAGHWDTGEFLYCPHEPGSTLKVFGEHASPEDVAAFMAARITMAVYPYSLLVAGLVWRVDGEAPGAWSGCCYSWHRDPGKWPPIDVPDSRLFPPTARSLRLVLASKTGIEYVSRRMLMPANFAGRLNQVIVLQRHANNNSGWYEDISDQITRMGTPAQAAASGFRAELDAND